MSRKLTVPISLVAALTLFGCDGRHAASPAPSTAASAPTLRTYQVPPGYGPKVRPIIGGLLSGGENDAPVGRAALAPNDRLVVLAPESVQSGVKSLVDDLAKNADDVAVPPTVTMTHWLVVVDDAPAPEGCGPKGLECVQGGQDLVRALEAVTRSQGPAADKLNFRLLEKLSVRSIDSEWADLQGGRARIKQRASVSNGKILADVSMEVMPKWGSGTVRTQLQFEPSQTVVLGQVAFDSHRLQREAKGAEVSDVPGMLLFVTQGRVEK